MFLLLPRMAPEIPAGVLIDQALGEKVAAFQKSLASLFIGSIVSDALQLVPDWADHSYCWMAWAVHPEWGKSTASVKEELREVILTISKYGACSITGSPLARY